MQGIQNFTSGLLLTLCLCAVPHPIFAFQQADLEALLLTHQENLNMPGLRAAVRLPDGKVIKAAVGYANLENETSLTDDIGMPGGSTGKSFVAALTMLLVEDGTLALNDPAAKWLGSHPWFQQLPQAQEIQVKHLLSHSSGLYDYINTGRFYMAMIWRTIRQGSAYFTPEELVGYAAKKGEKFKPGQGFHYSDAGYLVLGRLLEEASGQSYYQLVRARILDPLQLTFIRPQNNTSLTNVAMGYSGGAEALLDDGRAKFDHRSEWTGGGLITTPLMLVKFYSALAHNRLISDESLRLMKDSGFRSTGNDVHYGFGLFVSASENSIGHEGLWPGYRSAVKHFFDSDITIAVQTNRDGKVELEQLIQLLEQRAMNSEVR